MNNDKIVGNVRKAENPGDPKNKNVEDAEDARDIVDKKAGSDNERGD